MERILVTDLKIVILFVTRLPREHVTAHRTISKFDAFLKHQGSAPPEKYVYWTDMTDGGGNPYQRGGKNRAHGDGHSISGTRGDPRCELGLGYTWWSHLCEASVGGEIALERARGDDWTGKSKNNHTEKQEIVTSSLIKIAGSRTAGS